MLSHGLVLSTVFVLMQRNAPPVPLPEDTVVALEFVPAPPAAVAPTAPPSPQPTTSSESPAPAPEPQGQADLSHADQTPPTPTLPPDIAEPPAPPPDEVPAVTAEPKVEPPPAPTSRPVQPARPPHRAVAQHLPSQLPVTGLAMGSTSAAAVVPLSPARPVAGMEADRPPVYPELARRRGQQGRVLLQVDVSAQGAPIEVSVAQSSGFASLDDAALRAVQQWRFVPATRGGSPVPAVADVPVHFRLTD